MRETSLAEWDQGGALFGSARIQLNFLGSAVCAPGCGMAINTGSITLEFWRHTWHRSGYESRELRVMRGACQQSSVSPLAPLRRPF